MKKPVVFIAALVLSYAMVGLAEASRPTRYFAPDSLDLEIKLKSNSDPKSYAVLTASLKSLVGNITQMKIYFESSEDLEVSPRMATVENFARGAMKDFDLTVNKTSVAPNASGSWVRIRVEFLPDYQAIMKAVAEDRKTYPSESMKNQLLKSLNDSKTREVKPIQAKRFFFPSQK
jgi:hypothetical protein